MSVIFQLFSARDLALLTPESLDALKVDIENRMKSSPEPSLQNAAGFTLEQVQQKAHEKYQQDPQAISLDEIKQALQQRARMVWQQLNSQEPGDQPGGPLDLSQPIMPQLLRADKIAQLSPKETKILEMAISCELDYFFSYNYLRAIRDHAVDQFINSFDSPRRPGHDPDSPYAPYHKGHPLYEAN